jgi:hypothetical protein
MVQPRRISDLPEAYRERFKYMRTDEGLKEAVQENFFINTAVLVGEHREMVRRWPNLTEVTVKGLHYCHEDSPDEIGGAIAACYRSLDS